MPCIHALRVFVAAALLAFGLAGCVLQSPDALFPEAKGVAALEKLGMRFTSESLSKGVWVAEDGGEIIFTRHGKHYVARNSNENDEITVLFVPLGSGRFVLQAQEGKGKPFAYMIASISEGRMMMSPLFCDELKANAELAAQVTFTGTDCSAREEWTAKSFAKAANVVAPARIRLTPVK